MLRRNGYAPMAIEEEVDPAVICNTVQGILVEYEQRGAKVRELISKTSAFQRDRLHEENEEL